MTTFQSLGPDLPDIAVDLSVSAATAATPVYNDITRFVRSYERTEYGRQDYIAQVGTAKAALLLDNRDRREPRVFDPSYTTGRFYGGLKPLRRIRVQMRWANVVYPRCVMFTGGWPQSYPGQGADSTVTLQCFDGFGVANLTRFPAGFARAAEASDVRLGACLDVLGVPVADRSLEAGIATVAAVAAGDLDGRPVLPHMLDVADAEGGPFWVSMAGVWTFQNRHHRNLSERTVQGTFGDSGAGLRYRDGEFVDDESELWNAAQVTPASGVIQEHRDGTASPPTGSIGEFFERDWPRSLPMADDYDALARGQYVVFRNKDPQLRCRRLDVLGQADPARLWPLLLSLDISKQIAAQRFAGSGQILSTKGYVEGMSEGPVRPGQYPMSFQLSPADNTDYWVLGTSALGSNPVSP